MIDAIYASLDTFYERQPAADQQQQSTVALDTLVEEAKVGDVILFKCNSPHHVIVRTVCYTEFDHVGVVVVDKDGNKKLLESCVIGCCAYDLRIRVRQYQRDITHAIGWRRLVIADRPPAMMRACASFVEEVDGKPYDYNPLKIFFSRRAGDESRAAAGGQQEAAYYCSEIVAALYQRCGLLSTACKAGSFWPGDLADGGVAERWLTAGVRLAPMVRLAPAQPGEWIPRPA